MAHDSMREQQDEYKLQQTEEAQAEGELDTGPEPTISPAGAVAMLKGPLAGVQRQAIVHSISQNFGNKQVQRMLSTVRRSASSGPDGGPLEQDLSKRIQSERSGGQPLDNSIRRQVEASVGHDLSQVRVHTGSTAAELNSQMGAKAFTTGRDIFYGEGASPSDLALTTHEATHTVQQGFSEAAPGAIGAADTAHEQAAHAASMSAGVAGAGVQRESTDEDEVQMMRDPDVQRESADEDEVQMMRDPDVQRESAEDEEVQMMRDPAVQRESAEDEEV